jgi:hypothetical protein
LDYISIQDISEKLNISRVTVYNKLKNKNIYKELKPYLKRIKKVQYIHKDGIEILKKHITVKNNSKKVENINLEFDSTKEKKQIIDSINNLQVNYTNSLLDRIKQLEEQLQIKDKQLQNQLLEKDKQLQNKDDIIKNFQVLLKNEQENNIKILENNIKLLEPSRNKTYWNKIFKKKTD